MLLTKRVAGLVRLEKKMALRLTSCKRPFTSSKAFQALGLVAEGLYHLLALDHLVDQSGLLTTDGALALEILVAALGEETCHDEAQRGDTDHHQRDGYVLEQHEQQGAQNGQHAR